jgi:hypothetical protein
VHCLIVCSIPLVSVGGGGGAMTGCGGGWGARLAALLVVGFVLGSVDASLGDVDPQYR